MLAVDFKKEIDNISSDLNAKLSEMLQEQISSFSEQCEDIVNKYETGASKPKDAEIYQAVYLYLKGRITEDIEYLYDLVAYGLYLPIEVLGNKCAVHDIQKLKFLLNRYSFEAYSDNLLRDTWFAVLEACFHPEEFAEEQEIMLEFLNETYRSVYNLAGYKPSWLQTLEYYPEILSKEPCRRLAEHWFNGNHEKIDEIANNLHVPEGSWFWISLVRSCIKIASNKPDDEFIQLIPNILFMMDETPSYINKGIEDLMRRYNKCATKEIQEELKSLSISLWGNPRDRYSGASKWENTHVDVWKMSAGWVNDDYMHIFFERISERHPDKKTRLPVWLKYVEWSRYVAQLGYENEKQKDPKLAELFSMEEDTAFTNDEMINDKIDRFIESITRYLAVN